MNRFIQGAAGTVMFRMSSAAEHYKEDEGNFIVKYKQSLSRFFPTLLEAFLFYYTVEEEAELWDLTTEPVLVEVKIKLYLN
jgi:hypothetical protein